MAIKSIINSIEKDIEEVRIDNEDSVDYIDAKNGNDYKRVFTAVHKMEGTEEIQFKSLKDDATLFDYKIYGNTETKTRSYSGTASLNFPIIDGSVSNYRIYGNTVNGESVGDKTRNLFDVYSPLNYNTSISKSGPNTPLAFPFTTGGNRHSIFIPVDPNTTYTWSCKTASDRLVIAAYNQRYTKAQLDSYTTNSQLIADEEIIIDVTKGFTLYTFTTSATTNMIGIYYQFNISPTDVMLNEGSAALPYEPYGYCIPVTNNGETINIYLDEPLTKLGDNIDYIDYVEQKKVNADGTSEDITLPIFPAQTSSNSLLVGTIVQPSSAMVDVSEIVNCGDRTKNLFNSSIEQGSRNPVASGETDSSEACVRTSSYTHLTAGTYTIDCKGLNSVAIYRFNDNDEYLGPSSAIGETAWEYTPRTFTINSDCNVHFVFSKNKGSQSSCIPNDIYDIQVVSGATISEYEPYGYKIPITLTADSEETTNIYLDEPLRKVGNESDYIDFAEQKQHKVRKNLLQHMERSQTINGITFTVNGDKSITCNGMASATTQLDWKTSLLPIGSYYLNGTPSGGSMSTYYMHFQYFNNEHDLILNNDVGDGVSFIIDNQCIVSGLIVIHEGYTCNNLTFYPMIRKIDIEDDTYEPYIENPEVDITLPAISTLTGTNMLNIETEVKPVKIAIKGNIKGKIYGFHINPDVSSSSDAITYLKDAVGKTPAAMGNSTFSYGDWENIFFMPKPCMLKSNGKVDYYLDPNDYTKKLDGTASDVANSSYDGNAMMEWPKIWYKFVPGEKDGEVSFYVADYKADSSYRCWSNIDSNNNEIEHFYTAIYNGTGTTKLRSLSGVALTSVNGNGNTTVTQEVERAIANNTTNNVEWYTEVYSDRILINMLLILMGKSLNSQSVYGRGLDTGGREAKEAYTTGLLNNKGLFWGDTLTGTSGVKVFGMENFWGCCWHRTAGLITNNHAVKLKLTYGTKDGSTVIGYNQTGNGYIDNGTASYSNGCIQKMSYNKYGFMPTAVTDGSQSTYYADYYYPAANYTGTRYALFGGGSGIGLAAGAFCLYLGNTPGGAIWYIAASLSCKPLLN